MSWAVELVVSGGQMDGRFSRHALVDDFVALQAMVADSRDTVVEVHAYVTRPEEVAQTLVERKRDRSDRR